MKFELQKEQFMEYLELYKINPNDSTEKIIRKLLDYAFDLFCALNGKIQRVDNECL
ncbi:MAG: hypothetical protein IKK93_04905 [Campylobacter sp.]|nr:hypothetical protein [Campylobacter sp.]MBR6611567.1 hypothetical protein [Campylobacter sp.]